MFTLEFKTIMANQAAIMEALAAMDTTPPNLKPSLRERVESTRNLVMQMGWLEYNEDDIDHRSRS